MLKTKQSIVVTEEVNDTDAISWQSFKRVKVTIIRGTIFSSSLFDIL